MELKTLTISIVISAALWTAFYMFYLEVHALWH